MSAIGAPNNVGIGLKDGADESSVEPTMVMRPAPTDLAHRPDQR